MEEIKILIMKRRFILIIVNILFPSLKTGLSYQYWRTEQEFSTCPAYVCSLYTIYHQHMLLSFLSLAAASCLTHPLPSERKKSPSLRLYQAGKSITIKSSRTTTQTHSPASWLTKNCLASTLSRKHN